MTREELHLDPEMQVVLKFIDAVFKDLAPPKYRVEFTAGKEWFHHGMWSLHHSGNAIDVRTKTLPDKGVGKLSKQIASTLQKVLDDKFKDDKTKRRKFRVLYNDQGDSKPHIHIQRILGPRFSEPGDFGFGSVQATRQA